MIKRSEYICNNKFYLDPIIDMYDNNVIKVGICLASGKEYRIYILETNGKYNNIKLIYSDTEQLLKHHKKGGQSAQRFGRIRSSNYDRFVKEICEEVVKCYMSNNNTEYLIDKLIIGGPSELKKEIKDNELVQQYFGKIILKIISTDSINDLTINEVIDNSISEILNINHSLSIMDSLNKNPDFYVFGLENVLEKYLSGSLKCLMITDDLYDKLKHNFNNKKTTIIKCNNSEINTFGGIVGELYFIGNIDYIEN